MATLRSINALQEAFLRDGKPYWKLQVKSGNRMKTVGSNTGEQAETDIELSWLLLEERLDLYGSGNFSVEAKGNPKDPADRAMHYEITLRDASPSNRTSAPSMGSMGSMPVMFEMFKYFDQRNDGDISGMAESIYERASLEHENRLLKDQVERLREKKSFSEVLIGAVTQNPQIINHLLYPQQGIAGIKGGAEEPETGEERPQMKKGNVDLNRLVRDAQVLQQLLPDVHINDLFTQLVHFVRNNPEQAKLVIAQLLQNG